MDGKYSPTVASTLMEPYGQFVSPDSPSTGSIGGSAYRMSVASQMCAVCDPMGLKLVITSAMTLAAGEVWSAMCMTVVKKSTASPLPAM